MRDFTGSRSTRAAMILSVTAAAALLLLLAPGRGAALSSTAAMHVLRPARGADVAAADPRMRDAYRFDRGGWIYVHLSGAPEQVGFQHGYLLADEIEDALQAIELESTHSTKRDWNFFRETARNILWPHIEEEYRAELDGIVAGARARGAKFDRDDLVALNAFEEVPDYYVPWLNQKNKVAGAPHLTSPGNCSAFVATGSYTRGGKIVIAHNNWTSYWAGERWRIMFDIAPEKGQRMLMDGFPGAITSDDDFGVNASGLMITETTITQFKGFDPDGIPEFVRSRKAMQYATSIDQYVAIMLDGNNGGYANDWLLGDRKTGEIAMFELGLKNHRLWRTKDGYFVSSNFPRDPKVLAEETTFDPKNAASSPNARRTRWEELMDENKGKIDVAAAERFLGDHHDVIDHANHADERTLCGHTDATARGIPEWDWGAFYPGGAVQGKATDSSLAGAMSLWARAGHPCGEDFLAKPFLAAHPEYAWAAPILRDMKAGPWTEFRAGEKKP